MSLDVLHLDTLATEQDWAELSSYTPAGDGFEWRDLLTEQDIDASYHYSDDVRSMLHTIPAALARLQELGELIVITTVREAMCLAVCVLRLEGNGELSRAGDGSAFRTAQSQPAKAEAPISVRPSPVGSGRWSFANGLPITERAASVGVSDPRLTRRCATALIIGSAPAA